ncbi:MAG: ATP-binding cassette domain-containing protein [Actinomycetota bacterium]
MSDDSDDAIDGWFGAGPRPALRLERVVRSFPGPPEVLALAAIDLDVESGEFVAVLGTTGSGKTTLLHVLGLLDRPTAGRYLIDGVDVSDHPDADRAALRAGRIGLSLGPAHLLADRTAAENVDLALLYTGADAEERRRRVADSLERVSLGDRRNNLPAELSVGERRRVDLARALVRGPSLLLVDEPTRELDDAAAASLMAVLRELHRSGLTMVVTTDDARVAALADRSIRLSHGRLEVAP